MISLADQPALLDRITSGRCMGEPDCNNGGTVEAQVSFIVESRGQPRAVTYTVRLCPLHAPKKRR